MENYVVLGFDPSLNNLGWASVKWTPDGPTILAAGTLKTTEDADDLIKAGEIYGFLSSYLPPLGYGDENFNAVAFELPWTRPSLRSGWVAIKLGYVVGLIMAFAFRHGKRIIKVHARYNPDALGDFDKKPTKPMVRKRIKKLFGKDYAKTFHEMDAICVALSAIVQVKKDARGTPLEN